ncbi:MAG: glutathione S-transferase [Porticoccaceae bacterium]
MLIYSIGYYLVRDVSKLSKMTPVLYSFRRCPYAIRARMSLHCASITVELREVFLANKPEAMLALSSKGTVPVLQLADQVLDESLDVMRWALGQSDPENWLRQELQDQTAALIETNDGPFKVYLDHYKYWDRYPAESQETYRERAEEFLTQLESLLTANTFLLASRPTMADIAIFPFIRQFAFVDKPWFDQSPYSQLKHWLDYFLNSPHFMGSMKKMPAWQPGDSSQLFPSLTSAAD